MYLWNTNSGHLTCSWGREFDTIFRTPVQPHFGLVRLCNESRAEENLARYFRISVSGNDRQAGRKDSQLGARRWCHSSPDRPHSPRACSLFQALCQWRIEKSRTSGVPPSLFLSRIPLATDPACRPLAFSIVLTDREPGTGWGEIQKVCEVGRERDSTCISVTLWLCWGIAFIALRRAGR